MSSMHQVENHEPSAWFRQAIADRLTTLAPGGIPSTFGIVMLALNATEVGNNEDRTCDRCRSYTPPGTVFYAGISDVSPERLPDPWPRLLAGHQLLIGYGLCPTCAAREVGPLEDPTSITCPRCGKTSHHPDDVRHGYCGNCHDWTSDPQPTKEND